MLEVKVLTREPTEAEYANIKVYDDLDEYLKDYQKGKEFVRIGYENWAKLKVDNENYYCFSREGYYKRVNYDEVFLTEDVYKKILKYSKKKLKIHESDLFRTQRHSNCRVSDDCYTVEELLNYMKNSKQSWLPQVCKEIDEDIKKCNDEIETLKQKIKCYDEDKIKLYDDNYLKDNIREQYEFDSLYYKSIKG